MLVIKNIGENTTSTSTTISYFGEKYFYIENRCEKEKCKRGKRGETPIS